MSSNFETMCTIGGAGKLTDYFNTDWKPKTWSLFVVLGAVLGGFVGSQLSVSGYEIDLNPETIEKMGELGLSYTPGTFEPYFLTLESLTSPMSIIYLVLGGFFVGFGTRWANGCTSGHAISGLANFQFTSLIAVIGFFIGGLVMTHFLLPFLL